MAWRSYLNRCTYHITTYSYVVDVHLIPAQLLELKISPCVHSIPQQTSLLHACAVNQKCTGCISLINLFACSPQFVVWGKVGCTHITNYATHLCRVCPTTVDFRIWKLICWGTCQPQFCLVHVHSNGRQVFIYALCTHMVPSQIYILSSHAHVHTCIHTYYIIHRHTLLWGTKCVKTQKLPWIYIYVVINLYMPHVICKWRTFINIKWCVLYIKCSAIFKYLSILSL